jgi:hypothetical protein
VTVVLVGHGRFLRLLLELGRGPMLPNLRPTWYTYALEGGTFTRSTAAGE